MSISTRPSTLHVHLDRTRGPHRTDSEEVFWWLPVLGPTSTVLAYLLVGHGERSWSSDELARTVGLGGKLSKLWVALDRLGRFGVATFEAADVLVVRCELPPLGAQHLARLPERLAVVYAAGFGPVQ